MSFPLILKKLRTENNLSQKRLGELLGLSDSTIVAYERGRVKPSIEVAEKMADIFGVSLDYLFNRPDTTKTLPEKVRYMHQIYAQLSEVDRGRLIKLIDFYVRELQISKK